MATRTRYSGTTAPQSQVSGKIAAIFVLVLVLAFVVAFAKFLRTTDQQPVNISFASAEMIDDSSIKIIADISRKDTSVPSYCIVTALNYSMAEVGRREVYVPAGGDSVARWEIIVPTRSEAVSGKAYGCSEKIPFYLSTK
ncbi:DUF4307 domain-containing protein [Corynebacterium sp. HS2168-gen11]|uniref:DUF4307 domain-containing protein n=1 Tax=Corynebacterium sp. HS2168-gen11 TaxID=2974027 RepID=UPI00216B3E94|nr:DUF4307 domain-containing protein [Corynebacterium sp. HS2168-gen11]MCS4534980.1 DUF4307 domain-containing protein [Corynebacterium sp. HS2168-gen11]